MITVQVRKPGQKNWRVVGDFFTVGAAETCERIYRANGYIVRDGANQCPHCLEYRRGPSPARDVEVACRSCGAIFVRQGRAA
jgi:hypothetical protein